MPELRAELVENVTIRAYSNGIEVAQASYAYRYEFCDLRVDVRVDIINDEQIFNISVINNSKISSKYRLEIYVNHELQKSYTGELIARESIDIIYEFDNIAIGDYLGKKCDSNYFEIYV